MPVFPGDPLTPFVAATRDAKRLSIEKAPTLTKIPVLPISYGDATPLLRNLGGPVAPPHWRGALPLTYHLGPGPAKVHLKVEFNWDLAPAYNVIAKMRGKQAPDQWIIHGNHHDAWVSGARDPINSLVAMLEEARSIGRLAETGWQPRAHPRLRRLGYRGAGSAGIHRVGRAPRSGTQRKGRPLYKHRLQWTRLPLCWRLPHTREICEPGGS